MIRILQVVPSLNINSGMMSVVMNYYRKIDRSKVQFDFLYFGEMKDSHQVEIEKLGGHALLLNRKIKNVCEIFLKRIKVSIQPFIAIQFGLQK
jgi:hypothetical protein